MRFASFLFPLISLAAVAACSTTPTYQLNAFYGPIPDEEFPVSAVDTSVLNVRNLRQVVPYTTPHAPGTVIIDTRARFLYLVQDGGKAIRYGIGVGREGMEFSGRAVIHHKRRWPSWTPTPDMITRDPGRYRPYAKGMPGGSINPLGARALYLFKDGKDTLFRIHGTTEPWSVGQASSSGCIRMINQDVIDFYERVEPGTKVVVL
jgi:lipoprotein-anchoring transpeptidase ErfK/SrfK